MKPKDIITPSSCNNCGSLLLSWNCGKKNNSGIQDGRLQCHDISVLGCEECSETLKIIDGDEAAQLLSVMQVNANKYLI